jgi:hypothetical protein
MIAKPEGSHSGTSEGAAVPWSRIPALLTVVFPFVFRVEESKKKGRIFRIELLNVKTWWYI